jgi:hypothetical protein
VEEHKELKEKMEEAHKQRVADNVEELDRAVRKLSTHTYMLTDFENEHLYPLFEAHFNPEQLKYMAKDYAEARRKGT